MQWSFAWSIHKLQQCQYEHVFNAWTLHEPATHSSWYLLWCKERNAVEVSQHLPCSSENITNMKKQAVAAKGQNQTTPQNSHMHFANGMFLPANLVGAEAIDSPCIRVIFL